MDELLSKLVKIKDQIDTIDITTTTTTATININDCYDILTCIINEIRTLRKYQKSNEQVILQRKLEKVIQSLCKTLRLHKRQYTKSSGSITSSNTNNNDKSIVISIDTLMKLSEDVITELSIVEDDDDNVDHHQNVNNVDTKSNKTTIGYPTSVHEYKRRLEKHSKELYKNPPAMPPDPVIVIQFNTTSIMNQPSPPKIPTRDTKTQRITFYSPYESYVTTTTNDNKNNNKLIKTNNVVISDFHPNVTPEEVLLYGAFGGTYFRNIHSAVTNQQYNGIHVIHDTLAPEWIQKFTTKEISTKLTSPNYRASVNKFKSKCGGSLGMWESSGWISDVDPYGWFQWYCRFYRGRRSSDDNRQISRWKALAGQKGRFKSQLCNKILQKATMNGTSKSNNSMIDAINDISISPVVRQTLLHWGLLITLDVMDQHQKR